jgi:3-phosphoshikimate 1-carboxyvinyltransferase
VVGYPLQSKDTEACLDLVRAVGIPVDEVRDNAGEIERLVVHGGRWAPPTRDIDCRNSGTTAFLALSLAALQSFPVTMTGDDQLQRRSGKPLLDALTSIGARVEYHKTEGYLPLTITGPVQGGKVAIECPISQYLSGLLLAGPLTQEGLAIDVTLLNEQPYAGITLAWVRDRGAVVHHEQWRRFTIPGGQSYEPFRRKIPADFSSATFFLAAGTMTDSEITLIGLDMEDVQGDKAVVGMIRDLGGAVSIDTTEPSIRVGGGTLHGGQLDLNATPDALPALAILGTVCEEPLRLLNVPQARTKETDRIAAMASIINGLGGHAEELPDGLIVHPGRLSGGTADSFGDHRIAMAMAIAGLTAEGPITVTNAGVAAITFPGFYKLLASSGAKVTTRDN